MTMWASTWGLMTVCAWLMSLFIAWNFWWQCELVQDDKLMLIYSCVFYYLNKEIIFLAFYHYSTRHQQKNGTTHVTSKKIKSGHENRDSSALPPNCPIDFLLISLSSRPQRAQPLHWRNGRRSQNSQQPPASPLPCCTFPLPCCTSLAAIGAPLQPAALR
jgi:hypothetical protein